MMTQLMAKLGLHQDSSTPYYPQENGQVKVVNKFLTTLLRWIIGIHIRNWHLMFFSALWAYRTLVKTATRFTPFHPVYGLEAILPIECEISLLKLENELLPTTFAEEEFFLYLALLYETRRDAALANETHKKRVKAQFDKNVNPCIYSEGDFALVYDQEHDKLGAGKLEPMWRGHYIEKHALEKGAYELTDYDGVPLSKPKNALNLKKYYA